MGGKDGCLWAKAKVQGGAWECGRSTTRTSSSTGQECLKKQPCTPTSCVLEWEGCIPSPGPQKWEGGQHADSCAKGET
eukprot:7135371-Pyramimonas_sp.AAC.1